MKILRAFLFSIKYLLNLQPEFRRTGIKKVENGKS